MICYCCRAPLTRRLYWNSPNAPKAEDGSMFSEIPGPRPVCPKCAADLDGMDGKGKHLLRTFHAYEDGVGDGKKIVPAASSYL